MHSLGHVVRASLGLLICASLALTGLGVQQRQPASGTLDPKEFLARSITRLALIDLRAAMAPQEADYRLAHALLGIATETNPADAEILRRKIEAAYACGEDKAVLENTRTLVRLDPADTVAQLRLITALISDKAQNADDRLQVYDQFINDKRIDASIRSRLALDAALLLRERGDDDSFRKKLSTSCQLDSSHKEAAALAAAVIAERRPDDAMGRFQALQNLLMADPIDPNVHMALCRELINVGAFKPARRFHDNADVISQVAGAASERSALESMILEMHTDGPAAAAASINKQLQLARDAAQRDIRAAQAANRPTEMLRQPEEIRLSPNTHMLYVLALAAAGETESATASLNDFAQYVVKASERASVAMKRGELPAPEFFRTVADLAVQLHMTRLISGLQINEARKELNDPGNAPLLEIAPAMFRPVLNWLAAREGELDKAMAAFEEDSETNNISLLGIAVCHEAAGRTAQAIDTYRQVLSRAPLEPAGAWARTRMLALGSKEDTAPIMAVEAAAAKIPSWIDAMALEPQRFVQLTAEIVARDPSAIDRATLRIKLQNLSQIPLALGSDRPLSSRLLLAPKLEAVSGGAIDLAKPEVAHIDRRIRLMPNEALTVDLWPDAGQCGLLMESLANRSVRVRWRVVQGFQSDRRGGFAPGVLGISTESAASIRRPLSEATLPPEGLTKQITDGPINLIARLAMVTRADLIQPLLIPKVAEPAPADPGLPAPAPAAAAPANDEAMKPVADALAARYAKLGLTERCTWIVTLPHARLAPVMQPVDQAMRAETDPTALILVLATRVIDPQDELLVRCNESDDPRVREAAMLVQQRLASPDMIYARWTAADLSKKAAAPVEAPGVLP